MDKSQNNSGASTRSWAFSLPRLRSPLGGSKKGKAAVEDKPAKDSTSSRSSSDSTTELYGNSKTAPTGCQEEVAKSGQELAQMEDGGDRKTSQGFVFSEEDDDGDGNDEYDEVEEVSRPRASLLSMLSDIIVPGILGSQFRRISTMSAYSVHSVSDEQERLEELRGSTPPPLPPRPERVKALKQRRLSKEELNRIQDQAKQLTLRHMQAFQPFVNRENVVNPLMFVRGSSMHRLSWGGYSDPADTIENHMYDELAVLCSASTTSPTSPSSGSNLLSPSDEEEMEEIPEEEPEEHTGSRSAPPRSGRKVSVYRPAWRLSLDVDLSSACIEATAAAAAAAAAAATTTARRPSAAARKQSLDEAQLDMGAFCLQASAAAAAAAAALAEAASTNPKRGAAMDAEISVLCFRAAAAATAAAAAAGQIFGGGGRRESSGGRSRAQSRFDFGNSSWDAAKGKHRDSAF